MSVVNVKVKYLRPKYSNIIEWINDKNNVYIGRKNIVIINNQRWPLKSSPFANPFKVGKDGTREEVIKRYKIYIIDKIEKDSNLKKELLDLEGKNLGCWCKPESCHGDILIELIEKYKFE
uniref:DUF4326 domain-containing protein n=1 Tax=viral metagenome TaxID=1070528 RepID=A0A6C0AD11_9ZZZZ